MLEKVRGLPATVKLAILALTSAVIAAIIVAPFVTLTLLTILITAASILRIAVYLVHDI